MHQTKRKGELIMKEQNIKIVAKENNSSATGRKIAFGLTTFELALWVCSAVVVAASYFLSKSEASSSLLSLAASLVGVTALISGLTIGGKAMGKPFAMKQSKRVVYLAGRFLHFFHRG